jgi:hypothetical protein
MDNIMSDKMFKKKQNKCNFREKIKFFLNKIWTKGQINYIQTGSFVDDQIRNGQMGQNNKITGQHGTLNDTHRQ